MNDSQKGGARLMKSEHKRRELAPLLAIFGILVGLALASLLTPEEKGFVERIIERFRH